MSHESVQTLFIIVASVAIVMQAAVMLGLYSSARKIPGQIELIRAEVRQRLDPLAESITDILRDSREPVRTITTNLADISRLMRQRADNADSLLADLVDRSRVQIVRLDKMVTGLVERVESTADSVQRQVVQPVQELSAVVQGLRSGLQFLFSRRPVSSVNDATQDEQLFI
jgi:hypothetical protein